SHETRAVRVELRRPRSRCGRSSRETVTDCHNVGLFAERAQLHRRVAEPRAARQIARRITLLTRTSQHMPRTLSAAIIGCLAAASLHAQTVKPVWPDEGPFKWTPRPTSPDITPNDLRTRLYQFADDSMQGRRIGEPGNYKGTAYI